jgi:hypothetical protein
VYVRMLCCAGLQEGEIGVARGVGRWGLATCRAARAGFGREGGARLLFIRRV